MLIDYLQPSIQMQQFSFKPTRWQRLKKVIKSWLSKLTGRPTSN